MIQNEMDVTVEAGAFDNDAHKGKRARVVKIIGPIALVQIEGVEGLRGCISDDLKPRMTEWNFTRFSQEQTA